MTLFKKIKPILLKVLTVSVLASSFTTMAYSIGRSIEQPFVPNDDFNSASFRIPALFTMSNGNVMASVDVRYSTADSPNNLETGVRILDTTTNEWGSAILVNHFADWEDGVPSRESASFIDPVIVEGDNNRVFLGVDAYPHAAGYHNSVKGPGTVTVDGDVYYALADVENGGNYSDLSTFSYYFKRNESITTDIAGYYEIYSIDTNEKLSYSLDAYFNVYLDGAPLTVLQKPNNTIEVPMNIFYAESKFQLLKTSYLWVVHTDDFGQTWSYPELVGDDKSSNYKFTGFGPGQGLRIDSGEYEGRLLLPVYDDGSGSGERASALYSDDNGETWDLGERSSMASSNNPGKSSEAQIVNMPDGSIRMFARGTSTYIGYGDSFDGGVTFTPFKNDSGLRYGSNTMISVINYSEMLPDPNDNNELKPVLVASMPLGTGVLSSRRTNGMIRIGFINENEDPVEAGEKYTVDWNYGFRVNYDFFAYSCLTELPNGDIAILYEGHEGPITYDSFTLEELLVHDSEDVFYTLEFNLNGGEGDFPTQIIEKDGTPIAPTTEPTKEGYRFVGWYIDGNLTKPMVFENWTMTKSGSVFAKWAPLVEPPTTYTLQFNLNGGQGDFPTQTIIEGESPIAPTEIPTKEGYTFVGWYIDGNLTKPMIFEDWEMKKNGSVFAKWEEGETEVTTYQVSFNLIGGQGEFPTQTVAEGGKITPPSTNPTKEGFSFVGWFTDSIFLLPLDFDTFEVTSNTTIYAKWSRSINTVTFNLNGGEGYFPDQRIFEGGNATVPTTVPTKDGYVFDGWYQDADCTIPMDFSTVSIFTDITIYADWKDTTAYTLGFNLNGGVGDFPTQIIYKGENPIAPTTEPTKEGYTFAGWYIDGHLTKPMIFEEWSMQHSGNVFAKWISN